MAYLDGEGLRHYHSKVVGLINTAKTNLQTDLDELSADTADKVEDVKVNGTSVVSTVDDVKVANIPMASANAPGVVKVNSDYGVMLNQTDGQSMTIVKAGDTQVKAGTYETKAIVPANQHASVFYGLAKAAGDTTQAASDNAVGTYTNVASDKIRTMIDAAAKYEMEAIGSAVGIVPYWGPEGSSGTNFVVARRGEIVTLNGIAASSSNITTKMTLSGVFGAGANNNIFKETYWARTVPVKGGHKYKLTVEHLGGTCSDGVTVYAHIFVEGSDTNVNPGATVGITPCWTPAQDTKIGIGLTAALNAEFTNYSVRVRLIDMNTDLIAGETADAENNLVAQMTSNLASSTVSGNPIELTDSATANIKSLTTDSDCIVSVSGKNLLSADFNKVLLADWDDETIVLGKGAYNGADYYFPTRITVTKCDGDTITLKPLHTNVTTMGVGIFVKVLPSTIYTLSYDVSGPGTVSIMRYGSEKNYIATKALSAPSGFSFVTGETDAYLCLSFRGTTNGSEVTFTNFQLEAGSSATAYTPYQEKHTVSVTAGVSADVAGVKTYAPVTRIYSSSDVVITAEYYSSSKAYTDQSVEELYNGLTTYSEFAPAICETINDAGLAEFNSYLPGHPVKEAVFKIDPVQTGTGDPAVDNVRPISGWTGMKIRRCSPVNLVDVERDVVCFEGSYSYENGILSCTSSGVTEFGVVIPIKSGVRYTVGFTRETGGTSYARIRTFAKKPIANEPYIRGIACKKVTANGLILNSDTNKPYVFTANDGESWMSVTMYKSSGSALFSIKDIFVNAIGAEEYLPYEGNTYDVSFPTEAGEVYGGTLTVRQDGSGMLKAKRVCVPLPLDTWGAQGASGSETRYYYRNLTQQDATNWVWNNVICNAFPTVLINSDTTTAGIALVNMNSAKYQRVAIRPPQEADVTDVASFETWLSDVQTSIGTNIMFSYPVNDSAIPGYELTPEQVGQILMLAGKNVLFADTGNVTVSYPVDTKTYIDGTNMPMTAQSNIDNGKYFQIGRKLYLAATAIAAGETIVPGTNCSETTFADALNAILAQ